MKIPDKENLINCGERKIQRLGRIAIGDMLKAHGLNENDIVEVYIKTPSSRINKNPEGLKKLNTFGYNHV